MTEGTSHGRTWSGGGMCRDFFGGSCKRKGQCVYKHCLLKCTRKKCSSSCKLLHLSETEVNALNEQGHTYHRTETTKRELTRVCYLMYSLAPNKSALCFAKTIGSLCSWSCQTCERHRLEEPETDERCYAEELNRLCTWNCRRCEPFKTLEERGVALNTSLECNRCKMDLIANDTFFMNCSHKHSYCGFCIKYLIDCRDEALGMPHKICIICGESSTFSKIYASMYSLVQFNEDKVYYVCKTKNIKKRKHFKVAKWIDNHFYEAQFLVSSNNEQILTDICKNISDGYPVVNLERCEVPASSNLSTTGLFLEENLACESTFNKNGFDYAGVCSESENYIVCDLCSCLIVENKEHLCVNIYNANYRVETGNVQNYYCTSSESDFHNDSEEEVVSFAADKFDNLCMYCGIFSENLLEHLKSVHNNDGSGITVEGESSGTINKKTNYPNKQHYCLYCKTLHYKLARHLERKHLSEDEVKEAVTFKKGSKPRRLLFAELQKKGDFLYASENKSTGMTINMRRNFCGHIMPDHVICPYCKGFYSKKNLRNHVRKNCLGKYEDKAKAFKELGLGNLIATGRSVFPKMHHLACDTLKKRIFAVMRDDEITNIIAYDKLAVQYGNFLVAKYSSSKHHDKMIRSKLRLLARTFLEMKKADPKISEVMSIFDSTNFTTFVNAVYAIGGLNDGKFKNPSLGPTVVTLILQVGSVLETEAIQIKHYDLEKETKRFCKLVSTRANSLINKMAMENRTQTQRGKVVTLPKTDDVTKLQQCLDVQINRCVKKLKSEFEVATWVTLNKTLLIKIMVFNRKRPGDVERTQLIEYQNLQVIDEEQLTHLDENQKDIGRMYGRFITRGKLDRPAAILVNKNEMEAIQILLNHRSNAGVDNDNPYVFATPANTAEQFYRAGKALNDFCVTIGLQNKNLSATRLRKHFATITCTLDKEKQMQISDFMGHAFDIHQNIYRQRPATQDILEITKILKFANGLDAVLNKTILEENQDLQLSSLVNQQPPQASTSRLSPILTDDNILSTNSSPVMRSVLELEGTSSNIKKNSKYVSSNETSEDDFDADTCSVYSPDLSKISEEGDTSSEEKNRNATRARKRKRTEIFRKFRVNKKKTWTTPERSTVKEVFKNYFTPGDNAVPGLETCQEFLHKNDVLKDRTAAQVRAWIINEKKKSHSKSSPGWTTPMKQLCREHFKLFYSTRQYPSSSDMKMFINGHRQFEAMTIPRLRSHLQHDYNYAAQQYLKGRQLFISE